ncbi:hypothetical protein [Kurthia gibsonii]|uniref:hypothetical protein n=1 Tax=Kurthia gibsonii TaxID=33946 RepID=UPI002DB651E2|nr:hypothetical protein [Kurthia gibsonii]MEB7771070.1 hypothetical protein [Kurthia gibsonii]
MKLTKKYFIGEEYYKLLDIVFKEADIFEFTIKEEAVTINFRNILNKNRLDDAYAEFLKPLEEFLIERIKSNENLVKEFEPNYKIHIFRYKAINRSKEVLKTFTDHAFGWKMCETPEYLTFYKNKKELLTIVEDEDEIYIYKDGEDTIYPLIKNHDNWKQRPDY